MRGRKDVAILALPRFSIANLARTGFGIGMVVICLVTGCVRPSTTRPTLTEVLRLETGIRPTGLQSADTVRGRFFLRNIAATAVQLCGVDSGITVAAITERGLFPLVGHGITIGAPFVCYQLRPGEAKEFNEAFTWRSTVGAEQLRASIRVSTPGGDSVLINSDPELATPRR
jgi:hypothetical protein